jgi:hypothetical protein
LRFQAVEKIEEQRMRLDLLSGFVGKYKESPRKIELFIDGQDRSGVNAVEEKNSPSVLFAGGMQSRLRQQIRLVCGDKQDVAQAVAVGGIDACREAGHILREVM